MNLTSFFPGSKLSCKMSSIPKIGRKDTCVMYTMARGIIGEKTKVLYSRSDPSFTTALTYHLNFQTRDGWMGMEATLLPLLAINLTSVFMGSIIRACLWVSKVKWNCLVKTLALYQPEELLLPCLRVRLETLILEDFYFLVSEFDWSPISEDFEVRTNYGPLLV